MAITEVEKLAGIQFQDGAGSPADTTFLSVLESADPAWNQEFHSVIPAGHSHPTYVSILGKRAEIPWTCGQIASLLAELGNFGGNTSVTKLFYRLVQNMEGPDLAATASHTVFTAAKAFSYMMSLSAGHRKQAMMSGRTVPLLDGANRPLMRNGSSAIASLPLSDECFFLGSLVAPVGTVIEGCDDFECALNPEIYEISERSARHTVFASGDKIVPVASFVCSDRDIYDLDGTDVSGFKVHLLRGQNLEEMYTDVELQHIIGTLEQGVLAVQGKTSESPSRYRVEIGVCGDEAAGWVDNPISWDVNVAVDET